MRQRAVPPTPPCLPPAVARRPALMGSRPPRVARPPAARAAAACRSGARRRRVAEDTGTRERGALGVGGVPAGTRARGVGVPPLQSALCAMGVRGGAAGACTFCRGGVACTLVGRRGGGGDVDWHRGGTRLEVSRPRLGREGGLHSGLWGVTVRGTAAWRWGVMVVGGGGGGRRPSARLAYGEAAAPGCAPPWPPDRDGASVARQRDRGFPFNPLVRLARGTSTGGSALARAGGGVSAGGGRESGRPGSPRPSSRPHPHPIGDVYSHPPASTRPAEHLFHGGAHPPVVAHSTRSSSPPQTRSCASLSPLLPPPPPLLPAPHTMNGCLKALVATALGTDAAWGGPTGVAGGRRRRGRGGGGGGEGGRGAMRGT